jgi:plasmid stability protein
MQSLRQWVRSGSICIIAVNDVKDYNDIKRIATLATLTIRNLEDPLKTRLRMRAAARNRSMEEEARQILRAALQEASFPAPDLGATIRARFAGLGDVQLPIEAREPVRPPPAWGSEAGAPAGKKRSTGRSARRR